MMVFKNLVRLVELENRLLENHMDWQYIADGRMINKFDLKIDWKENGHNFKDLWEDTNEGWIWSWK